MVWKSLRQGIWYPIIVAVASVIVYWVINGAQREWTMVFGLPLAIIETEWRPLLVLSVLVSLWAQLSVARYFDLKQYFAAVELRGHNLQLVEKDLFLVVTTVAAIVAIVSFEHYLIHVASITFYVFCIVVWDAFFAWDFFSTPTTIPDAKEKRREMKQCCRRLFFLIDCPAFVVIGSFALLTWKRWNSDVYEFALRDDWRQLLGEHSAPIVDQTSALFVHSLAEPVMAGVVGFHLAVTVLLLFLNLADWETGKLLP